MSSLSPVASGIYKLEKVIGTIPNVLSKGTLAKKVLQKILRFRADNSENVENSFGAIGITGKHEFMLAKYCFSLSSCINFIDFPFPS